MKYRWVLSLPTAIQNNFCMKLSSAGQHLRCLKVTPCALRYSSDTPRFSYHSLGAMNSSCLHQNALLWIQSNQTLCLLNSGIRIGHNIAAAFWPGQLFKGLLGLMIWKLFLLMCPIIMLAISMFASHRSFRIKWRSTKTPDPLPYAFSLVFVKLIRWLTIWFYFYWIKFHLFGSRILRWICILFPWLDVNLK